MKNRKVIFKRWIPIVYEEVLNNQGGSYKKVKGQTNCWESDFINEGTFHKWGVAYDEFETGPGNYTVAIIELIDGTVEEVLPFNLKFI